MRSFRLASIASAAIALGALARILCASLGGVHQRAGVRTSLAGQTRPREFVASAAAFQPVKAPSASLRGWARSLMKNSASPVVRGSVGRSLVFDRLIATISTWCLKSLRLDAADMVVAAVTTAGPRSASDVRLGDWQASGLRAPSTVRLSRLDCLEQGLLVYRLGSIAPADAHLVKSAWDQHIKPQF